MPTQMLADALLYPEAAPPSDDVDANTNRDAVHFADGGVSIETEMEVVLGASSDDPPGATRLACSSDGRLVVQWVEDVPVEVWHELNLTLTTDGGAKATSDAVPVRLVRNEPSGDANGELATVLPTPPRPWNSPVLKGFLQLLAGAVGTFAAVVALSFAAPRKCEWLFRTVGVADTAEYIGLVDSSNGTAGASSSARSMLAAGTQTVQRFLGAAGRRM